MSSKNVKSIEASYSQSDNLCNTLANIWGIPKISTNILSTRSLTTVNVAKEMGINDIEGDATDASVNQYMKKLNEMKDSIKDLAKRHYQKACLQEASLRGCVLYNSWKDIGKDYQNEPTWKNASNVYHTLYTSTDKVHQFKRVVMKTWLEMYNVEFSEPMPIGREVTGVESIISVTINNMRKNIMLRLSKEHGYKILKTEYNSKEKQGKRRKINCFKKEYVINTIKGKINEPHVPFEEYLT
jgi:hypothetical protein